MAISDSVNGDLSLDRRKRLCSVLYSVYDGAISYARVEGERIIPIENFNHFVNALINLNEERLRKEEGIVGAEIFKLSCNGGDASSLENYLEICEKIRTELFN